MASTAVIERRQPEFVRIHMAERDDHLEGQRKQRQPRD